MDRWSQLPPRDAISALAAALSREDVQKQMQNAAFLPSQSTPAELAAHMKSEISRWGAGHFTAALRHDQSCPDYNLHFRQFLHISFKIAGEMNGIYTAALDACEAGIAPNVTGNLLNRHLRPIFG